MLAGELYSAVDPELIKELNETKDVLQEYNRLKPTQLEQRRAMLMSLLGHVINRSSSVSDVNSEAVDIILQNSFLSGWGSRCWTRI